jgi:hypothetical protein
VKVSELKKIVNALKDDELEVLVQVVAKDGTAWNCGMEINELKSQWVSACVQVRVSHPSLLTMPRVEGL